MTTIAEIYCKSVQGTESLNEEIIVMCN